METEATGLNGLLRYWEEQASGIWTARAVINRAGSLSSPVRLNGALVGIIVPADWTPAVLTFKVSMDGLSWHDLYDENGNEVVCLAGYQRYIRLNRADWLGIRYLRVRSGTALQPVPQALVRVLTLVTTARA